MGSAAVTTVVKMMETLPENTQNLVVEHLREYIATMQTRMRGMRHFSRLSRSTGRGGPGC